LSSSLQSRNVKIKTYKTTILPDVLYGSETWSLTLRESYRLWVFENSVVRTMFVPNKDKVTEEWMKLHSEELHNLYSSPDIFTQVTSRTMRWAGHVARTGEEERIVQGFGGKARRKRPLGWDQNGSYGDWLGGVHSDVEGIGRGLI
jgi:hypothetical protein